MIAPVTGGLVVPARARELAARLSALLHQDSLIVGRLNGAQRRLREANERLWCGLSPDAFGLVYGEEAPAGQSQIAGLIEDALGGEPDAQAAVLHALQQIRWTIHRAFCEFDSASEERRQLAVEVGELSRQLTEALMSAGWSADDAQNANVHELSAAGI